MDRFTYMTRGVCSRAIEIAVENDVIESVRFIGGCAGNTQGVAALIKGMRVEEAVARIEGIDCRGRGTSCPDQLARALREYLTKQ
jgi:uncharacterized protein (TIGR03905 family)